MKINYNLKFQFRGQFRENYIGYKRNSKIRIKKYEINDKETNKIEQSRLRINTNFNQFYYN